MKVIRIVSINNFFVYQKLAKGIIMVHFINDIAASNQFPIDEELRVGGPLAVKSHLLPDDWIFEHINVLVLLESIKVEDFHHEQGVSTTRCIRAPFHE